MTETAISSGSTMREVLEVYPGAQRALMRRYHIGGCQSCGFAPDEKLGDVLKRHDVQDVDGVIEHVRESHEQDQRIAIEPKELAAELAGTKPPVLIDVRQPEEQDIAMIDGARPATQALMQEMMTTWAKDTPVVCCCHHGLRSLDAASYLIGHGFTNVRSLAGGIDAWSEQVDPKVPRY